MAGDEKDVVIRTFLTRFDLMADEFTQNQADVEHAQALIEQQQALIENKNERNNQLRAEAEQLKVAGELLGFNLYDEVDRERALQVDAVPTSVEPPDAVAITADSITTPPPSFNMTIRKYILEEAQKAYPDPVRATSLRNRLFEQWGEQVHEKTFGMTLYRMSKEQPPLMERRGKQDWYFVPNPATAEGEAMAGRLF